MLLPFWNSELQVEIPAWFPWGKDYQPVSVNRFHDSTLKNIAALCFDLESEFFFMASPLVGCVGNLPREKFFHYSSENIFNLGFLMMFGFSELLEKAIIISLAYVPEARKLSAGVTSCALWRGGIFEGNMKVIAVAGDDPFYDGNEYLKGLEKVLSDVKAAVHAPELSYYAEKFGYDRFLMKWENENLYDVRTSQLISEIEDKGTQEIVGGSSKINFPPFFGVTIAAVEK